MKTILKNYSFVAEVWKYDGAGGWYFASIPSPISREIRLYHKDSEEGWGRLKVEAKIKESYWDTSIWFDKKMNGYILPIKAQIRKQEGITAGSVIKVLLSIEI